MKSSGSHMMTLLFSLALLSVFAVSSLLVVIFGARVYNSVSAEMSANYNTRTSISYIAEKVRQSDAAGAIELSCFGDGDALLLRQSFGGEEYRTVIYTSGGMLRELLTREGVEADPVSGQPIMPVSELQLSQNNGLLIVTVTDENGLSASVSLAPRCG